MQIFIELMNDAYLLYTLFLKEKEYTYILISVLSEIVLLFLFVTKESEYKPKKFKMDNFIKIY